ncbi:MAG TPA: hypothetical protein VLQ45_16375 [Thermoanaerobaculia bacterium]|nr:hypothetical protein [Thermoanaerobaculia bacterium]
MDPILMRPAILLLAGAALLVTACGGRDYPTLFETEIAKPALECMHPRGEFQSARDVQVEGDGVFTGSIHWRGRLLENNYTTKVRVKIDSDVATVYLLEEDSLMPASEQTCQVALPPG